jgi:zinc protease
LTTGGTVEEVLEWPEALKAVTAEQILEVGRTYMVRERAATGLLIPEPQERADVPGADSSGDRS